MAENKNQESFLKQLASLLPFWNAQQTDWKVTVVRTSLERFGYQMVYSYLSLYIILQGASKAQLGSITSVATLLMGILGPYIGSFIDRNGAKKIYVMGIVGLLISYITYAAAPDWRMCAVAMVIYYFGQGLGGQSCAIICGNCLKTEDRAKGMLVCESLAAGFLGMAGPMVAVFLLRNFAGVAEGAQATADQLRILFYASATCTFLSLLVVLFKLSDAKTPNAKSSGHALKDSMEILKGNKNARKWLIIAAVGNLPMAMVLPYVQVFAAEAKGASAALLATLVTAHALTSTVLGYPLGILADKYGRKAVLNVIVPLYWLSLILLIVAPSPAVLLLSGILQGFYYISQPIFGAIQREIVDPRVMGTWIGFTKLTNSLISAAFAVIAGNLYDKIGGAWVFGIYIACDLCIRMPLMNSLPDAISDKKKQKNDEGCCDD